MQAAIEAFGSDPGTARITVDEEHAILTDLFTLDSTQEICIPSNSQETSSKMYTILV